MQVDVILTAIIGGCAGAIVSAIASVVNTWRIQGSEERRQLREITMNAAIENYKTSFEIAKLKGELTGTRQSFPSLDVYVIHMLKITELVSSKTLSAANVGPELAKIRAITKAATEH